MRTRCGFLNNVPVRWWLPLGVVTGLGDGGNPVHKQWPWVSAVPP